jgi:putative ABC transport system permease protein
MAGSLRQGGRRRAGCGRDHERRHHVVSVTERTREIGIRTAIGARREDILGQLLVEAPALSIAGGAIGVVFGVVGSIGTAHVAGWPTALAPSAILLAFGFAAAVGIFFGYYPARKACEVDPIRSK